MREVIEGLCMLVLIMVQTIVGLGMLALSFLVLWFAGHIVWFLLFGA